MKAIDTQTDRNLEIFQALTPDKQDRAALDRDQELMREFSEIMDKIASYLSKQPNSQVFPAELLLNEKLPERAKPHLENVERSDDTSQRSEQDYKKEDGVEQSVNKTTELKDSTNLINTEDPKNVIENTEKVDNRVSEPVAQEELTLTQAAQPENIQDGSPVEQELVPTPTREVITEVSSEVLLKSTSVLDEKAEKTEPVELGKVIDLDVPVEQEALQHEVKALPLSDKSSEQVTLLDQKVVENPKSLNPESIKVVPGAEARELESAPMKLLHLQDSIESQEARMLPQQRSVEQESNKTILAAILSENLSAQFVKNTKAVESANLTTGLIKNAIEALKKESGISELKSNNAQDQSINLNKQDKTVRNEARIKSSAARANSTNMLEKIEAALREAMRSKDGKTITVRLDPPQIGKVKVDVTLSNGNLHARLNADNHATSSLLRERSLELVQMLRKSGVNVDKVTIAVASQDEFGLNQDVQGDGKSKNQHEAKSGAEAKQSNDSLIREILGGAGTVDMRNLNSEVLDHWVA